MESYTCLADQLYKETQTTDSFAGSTPFVSCYLSLFQQEELYRQARNMEVAARDIRNQFQEIAKAGLLLPTSTLLRKAVLSVKRGKEMFSTDQLSKVVSMLMKNLPFILFRPKSNTKDYVILLFWATSIDESDCEVQRFVEVVKQEIAVDGFQLRFTVENVPSPRRQFLYLLNNYVYMKSQNDSVCQLPPDDRQQLQYFFTLLKEPETTKKRKVDIVSEA